MAIDRARASNPGNYPPLSEGIRSGDRRRLCAWCWGGGGKIEARQLFQSMKDELEEVDVEGWRAVALRATLEPMQRLEPAETIHLLPLFDAYTIGMPRDLRATASIAPTKA